MFFGLKGKELPLEDIGKHFGITKERARQIKDSAIIKLRKSKDLYKLADLLN